MLERVQELTNELNTAKEQKEVISRFIEQTEDIPPIVLKTLKQKVRRLKITVQDCELRLKNYE
ncbi:hypothetical protein [Oceanobacillus sp. J11TS1]|uniref:hypothetical protein n=1 Tax=Oceanobacillus sp. J11TS1 TaxID=2807191 RepID=UPI001B2423E6|nr:hypothetical protein [Oceanobacillus sp. J11TS1]GIO24793.1 hypothetical protein J11TS1_33740 [Oceanobacillus sp. J11TS1]